MKILLSAGHSNTDPGAVNGKYKEADLVTVFRNAVAHYCREAGLEVITDGSGITNQPLRQAVKLIKGTNLAVEFHLNSASNKSARGIEALSSVHNRKISQAICEAIYKVTGFTLRGDAGWKPENEGQHSRLAFVSGGGIIVELFFISNDDELNWFLGHYWLIAKEVAQAIIDAV